MAVQYTPFAVLTGVSAVISLLVAVLMYPKQDRPGVTPLVVMFVGAAVWAVGSTGQVVSVDLGAKMFWSGVRYVGIVMVPAAWLVFAVEYTGYEDWITVRRVVLLAVEPFLVIVLVVSNETHELFLSQPAVVSRDGVMFLSSTYEIGFWVHSVYSYLLLGTGTFLILLLLLRANDLYWSQVGALVVSVLVPWGTNVGVLLGVFPVGLHPTPIGFILSGIALTWAVFRHDFLETIPVTRVQTQRTLVETMGDPVIAIDQQDRVIEANPAARALLEMAVVNPVGQELGGVFPELGELTSDPAGSHQVSLERTGVTRFFDAQITPLDEFRGTPRGFLIVLRDVTNRERHRQRLEVLNRVLRHDLRNEMNLILGYADELLSSPEAVPEYAARIKEIGFEIMALSKKARQVEESLSGDDIVLERVNVGTVLSENLVSLGDVEPTVEITSDIPDDVFVFASPLIGTAVENLLRNAIEHNDQSTQEVAVSVSRSAVSANLVEIVIADNGPGIPMRERSVLEKGTETPLEHSSGLGLWLVNWIVTESGGEIEFAENEPAGTITTIRLLEAPAMAPNPNT